MSGVASLVSATSVADAVAALAAGARPVAGGTDLVVGARQGKASLPSSLVAIDRLDALRGIMSESGEARIGALTTHADLVASALVRERLTAIADASAIVGSHATRAHGTLGGNVMNASPAMETGGPLLCFAAEAVLASERGERRVPLDALWTGPGRTTAEADELLIALSIPLPAGGTGSAYIRLEYRRQMEIAIAGVTAVVTVSGDAITSARVAITALSPVIRRVPEAEAALVGSGAGDDAIAAAAAATAASATPISDVRASDRYRRAMTEVIARRAIQAALVRARGGTVPIPASPASHGGIE